MQWDSYRDKKTRGRYYFDTGVFGLNAKGRRSRSGPRYQSEPKAFATEAAFPGGELAGGGSENGYAALVAPISGWRKVFCDGSQADSAKVFVSGGKSERIEEFMKQRRNDAGDRLNRTNQ